MKVNHMALISTLVLTLPLVHSLHAQPVEQWVARYEGTGYDDARDIAVDNMGNVYVTGFRSFTDYATIKYNALGEEEWVAVYNGTGNGFDQAWAIAIDGSGNVYVTGKSPGSGTSADYATIKYNNQGVQQWVARYNGPGNGTDEAYALGLDGADNVYVSGRSVGSSTSYDYAIIKYNNQGVQQWVERYNGPGNGADEAYAMAVDSSGNVYVTGGSEVLVDCVTIKYDPDGAEQWVARHAGLPAALAIDGSGNTYITGWAQIPGNDVDYLTVKYDSQGNEQWVALYNGPNDNQDEGEAIAVDDLGNVYITGGSQGLGFGLEMATVKYDGQGQQQWVARYSGYGGSAAAIVPDRNGNVFVAGWVDGATVDYATIMYDAQGGMEAVALYDGPGNNQDAAHGMAVDDAGYVYVTGGSLGLGTDNDFATIKYTFLPGPVSLLFPVPGAIITWDNTTFVWRQGVSLVDHYWLERSTDSLFTISLVDSLLADTTHIVSGLQHGETHWWKVRAHNSFGWGEFSQVNSFLVFMQVPSPPLLLSPPDGAGNVPLSPIISWNPTQGAELYALQISDTTDFSTLIVNQSDINGTSFQVSGLSSNNIYYWRVNASNALGTSDWSEVWSFTTLVTKIAAEEGGLPLVFALNQNYPNPFNPKTTITFHLSIVSEATLSVYDLLGRELVTLVNEKLAPGAYMQEWDARGLPSGVYLYRLAAGDFIETRKLILLK